MQNKRKIHKRYNFNWLTSEYNGFYGKIIKGWYTTIGSGMNMYIDDLKGTSIHIHRYGNDDSNTYYAYIGYFQTRSLKALTKSWKFNLVGRYPTLEGAKKACEIEIVRRIKSASRQLEEIKIKE